MLNRFSSLVATPFVAIADIATLALLAVWQGLATLFTDEDWNRITGPHGLVFVLIIGLIVVWAKSVKDDGHRERRHKEMIKSQQDHFDSLLNLNAKTADDLKVLTIASTKAQMSATNAIISMDHNIIRLTNELSDQAKITLRKSRRAERIERTDHQIEETK